MSWRATVWLVAKALLGLTLVLMVPGAVDAQVATTTVTETVYHADGTPAGGEVLVSWPSFTAANGASVPAGTTTVTIDAAGVLSVGLVPNAGATPIGSYYTAVYHLDDGSVTQEYWVVPVSSNTVQVSSIKSTVMPLSVAQQTVSKAYVDTAIATAVAGHPLSSSTPYVLKAGDTMTGPLVLPGDPTAPLQAADMNYVDEQAAGLTAGLAQKVSTAPAGSQTVTQPGSTTLAVNNLNGVGYASQFVTGTGNNGIANAAKLCSGACEVVAEPTYGSTTEMVKATSLGNGTHVADLRGGAVEDTYFNPASPVADGSNAGEKIQVVSTAQTSAVMAATGSSQVFSIGLAVEDDGLTGGNNQFPQHVQGTIPYFKTTYSALAETGNYNTMGQHVLEGQTQNCYGVGDCLLGGKIITSSGGFRDDSDEGAHAFDVDVLEDTRVFEATCASGCTTGSTSVQLSVTANPGTQGEGRFLIDTAPSKLITGGAIVGGTSVGAGARQPQVTFSGTSFPVSTLLETAQTIPTQATSMAPGVVSVAIATTGVPGGFQTNTAALPGTSGVACVTDVWVSDGRSTNYEMANYTTLDATHLQMTLNKPHASGATIAVGGLCGYGLEQTVDTSAGIRQVFPVVGSTSATSLLYAGGFSAIVGVQGNTSAYLNINAAIAAIARSGNVVSVTTAGNLGVDVNGLTLTIAGVADSSYNGSFPVTSTGPNSFTYVQSGASSTSGGGSASILTGNYVLYPMAEVLGVFNSATKAVDGQMTLAANTVPWAVGDTVEQPHYYQQRVSPDVQLVTQYAPRPTLEIAGGIWYGGNESVGLRGWQIANTVPSSSYLGNGGTHTAPDAAFEGLGVWQRSMSVQAGERAAFAVHCNSHGCGKWNSTYNLFEMDSNSGVDSMQYSPVSSTLNLSVGATAYTFSPQAFTVGTVNATTVNAGTLHGTIAAANLPLFGPSGASHEPGAVPDPGGTAGNTRYLREDGSWVAPSGGASISGSGLVYDVAGSSPRAAVASDIGSLTQGSSTVWSRYVAFGDSITACCSPSIPANLYVNRLGTDAGLTPVNDGISGAMACDVANNEVFPNENPGDDKNALYTLMISTNEANIKGAGAYEPVFNACHQASIAWLGSSSSNKYTGASFATVPANWVTDTTYAAVTGLKSTTNGATSSWPVTTYGGPIALWYRIVDGNGGAFTYSVDGGSPVAVNAFTSPAIATGNGATQGVAVAFSPVPAGTHTVTLTVTSASGAGNVVSVLAVGTSPAATHFQGPKVYVAGTPYQLADANSATTAEYNADILANVGLLQGYGFGAQFVDVRRYLFGTAAEMASGSAGVLHPGDLGHQHLEQAFEAAIKPVNSSAAPCQNNNLRVSSSTNDTILPGDGSIYLGAGGTFTLPNPNTLPAGQCYTIAQFSNLVVNLAGGHMVGVPTLLGPTYQSITIQNQMQDNWVLNSSTGLNPPAMNGTVRVSSSSTTLTASDGTLYVQGGTLTLPAPSTIASSGIFAIFNYGSGPLTISGAMQNVPTSIPAGASILIQSQSQANWWMLASQGLLPPSVVNRGLRTPVSAVVVATVASTALYQVDASVACDAVSTGAVIGLSVGYTDPSGTAQTITGGSATCTTLGAASVGSINGVAFQAKGGTNITYTATDPASASYDVSVALDRKTAN